MAGCALTFCFSACGLGWTIAVTAGVVGPGPGIWTLQRCTLTRSGPATPSLSPGPAFSSTKVALGSSSSSSSSSLELLETSPLSDDSAGQEITHAHPHAHPHPHPHTHIHTHPHSHPPPHSPFPPVSIAAPWEGDGPDAADTELLLLSSGAGGCAIGWKAVLSVEGMRDTRVVGMVTTPLLVTDRRTDSPPDEGAEEDGAWASRLLRRLKELRGHLLGVRDLAPAEESPTTDKITIREAKGDTT